MSDILNIRVTEAELDLIMLLLEQAGTLEDSNGQPAFELLHDLMEQAARPGDWTEDLEPTDLDGRTFTVAESDFIDHGIRAREMAKNQKTIPAQNNIQGRRGNDSIVNKQGYKPYIDQVSENDTPCTMAPK